MTSKFFTSAALGMPMFINYMRKQNTDINESNSADEATRRAICILDPQPNQTASGVVRFEQEHFYSKT